MAAVIADNDFLKIQGALRIVPPSVVFNKPHFLNKKFKEKLCYAVLTLNLANDKIEASISWQDSGFDLEMEYKQNPTTHVFEIHYTIRTHENWLVKYDAMTDSIIEDLIKESVHKVNDALAGKKEEMNARNFRGVIFRKKKLGRDTPRFHEVVDSAKTKGMITNQFKNFVKKYSTRLVAVGYPPKDYP